MGPSSLSQSSIQDTSSPICPMRHAKFDFFLRPPTVGEQEGSEHWPHCSESPQGSCWVGGQGAARGCGTRVGAGAAGRAAAAASAAARAASVVMSSARASCVRSSESRSSQALARSAKSSSTCRGCSSVNAGRFRGSSWGRYQARLRVEHAYVSGAVRPCTYLNKILNHRGSSQGRY